MKTINLNESLYIKLIEHLNEHIDELLGASATASDDGEDEEAADLETEAAAMQELLDQICPR